MCVNVARKTRVETYLDPETVAELEAKDVSMSEYVRTAVNEKLERERE